MAQGLFPVFKPRLTGTQPSTLGETLVADLDDLEELAEKEELMPLSAFMDNREPPDDFDGAPEELDEAMGSWDEWFEPEAGVSALEALAASVGDLANASELETELLDIARVVKVAAKRHGMKFRIELG